MTIENYDATCPHYKFHFWDALVSSFGDRDCLLTARDSRNEFGLIDGTEYSRCDCSSYCDCPRYKANAQNLAQRTAIDVYVAQKAGQLELLLQ